LPERRFSGPTNAFAQTVAEANPARSDAAPATIPVETPASEPASRQEPARDDKVIELSPFVVAADEDIGYQAQNTLAGSRLNSSLKDTPGVLDILTSDFLADIGALNLEQALAFSTNFAEDAGDFDSQGVINTVFPSSQAGVPFRNRGQGGTIARNYLETDFRPSFYTVERIDNSSGPNSILFGLGSAGGVANITTKTARLQKNLYGIDYLHDSNGTHRTTIDFNQVLKVNRLGLRLNAIHERGKKYRANFSENMSGVQLAGTFRVNDRTEVRFEHEQSHNTGTVAYPGPHLENLSAWTNKASPQITLPANWETLSTTARAAYIAANVTPNGMIANSTTVRPVVVQNGAYAYIVNAANHITTSGTNRQSIDPQFFTDRGNLNGPAGRKTVDRNVTALSINHRLLDDVYLNLSGSREYGYAETFQAFANGAAGGATILADPATTIPNPSQILNLGTTQLSTNSSGQVVNPFAGSMFTESRWLHRTQRNDREILQGTAVWKVNLGKWLGSHSVIGSGSYMERTVGSENFRDSWLNAPFNTNPLANTNGVTRRRYASSLDAEAFYVPDWRDFPTLTWTHPTRGPITTGWISEGANLRYARQISTLAALQSAFWNRRLVLTTG
jgi:iron complex outermembrane recepter protein